jgi:hypothetical protein
VDRIERPYLCFKSFETFSAILARPETKGILAMTFGLDNVKEAFALTAHQGMENSARPKK